MQTLELHNVDCEDFVSDLPDGHFDITIADPPYGIGRDWLRRRRATEKFSNSAYDGGRPSRRCIEEIVRVSKRWVIFGWNYFTDILPPTNYLIVWDKMSNANQVVRYSKCEIAGTNVRIPCNLVSIPWDGYRMGEETGKKKIHPHQKPVALYRWLLDFYAPGNRDDELFNTVIFDPFAGSASCGVACKERGYSYVGCEKDKVFCAAAAQRLGIGIVETEGEKP